MNHILKAAAIAATAIFANGGAWAAADCPVTVLDPYDLEADDIDSIYDCMKDGLVAGYASQGNEIAADYRNWAVTATRMAVAGPHGSRLLLTFANSIAAETYLKFEEEGVNMPVGSVLAKESIKINKKKKMAVPGPLFLMTKVAAGELPDTNDWRYDALTPSGKVMKIKQAFCYNCHQAFEDQDDLGYPVEEVRVSN